MPGYDGAGGLYALGMRLTRLDATGAPLVGTDNGYTTNSLISIGFGLSFSDPTVVSLSNGQGITCVSYTSPATLLGGTIDSLKVCQPDPNLLAFLAGGTVITQGGSTEVQTITVTGTPTGGTFTLSYAGQTTTNIAYNATSAAIVTALTALSVIGTGGVTGTGGPLPTTPVVITFAGQNANTDVAQITATASFTGGTTPAIAVTTTTAGGTGGTAIGYQAPAVNVDPNPTGVGIEAWSYAILNNAIASSLPYYHWVVPRAKVRPANSFTLDAENPTAPEFSGTCEQNPNFGDGPTSTPIPFPTTRVWQYSRVASIPTLSGGPFAVV